MSRFYAFCAVCAVIIASVFITACGSSWEFHGNKVNIIRVDKDTVAPAGSYIMMPCDSDSTFSHN